MHSSLDHIEFLARSASRVEVLDALHDGAKTRDELEESIDASRVTLDRALDDLEERDWLVRTDGRYEATSEGAFIATEMDRLRSRIPESEGNSRSAGVSSTESALEVVAFLSRSSSRLTVLDAICESPRTRRELAGLTDASRATLSRILAELEDREWIDGTNHQYEATRQGMDIVEALTRSLSNVAAADELDDVLGWLPIEEFDFELACLRDAELILADYWESPTRSIDHVAELVRSADRVRLVGPGARREVAESIRTLTVNRGGTVDAIMGLQGVETIRNDDVLQEHFREILETGRATFSCHEGARPILVVAIVDDIVGLFGSEDRTTAHDGVVSDHEQVIAWAESYFEAAKANARPLDTDSFTP